MESPIITTSNTCVSSLETKIGEGFHFAIFQGKYNFGKMLSFFLSSILLEEYTSGERHCPGTFWAYIVGQDPSDSKSNRLHVDIVRFFFTHLKYIS